MPFRLEKRRNRARFVTPRSSPDVAAAAGVWWCDGRRDGHCMMNVLTGVQSSPVEEEQATKDPAIEEPRQQDAIASTSANPELPEEIPWVPPMDAIRKARVAEVEALEEVFGALASKQQTSITKLRTQMDKVLAWKAQTIAKERKVAARRAAANTTTNGGKGTQGPVREDPVAGGPAAGGPAAGDQRTAIASAVVTTTDVGAIEGLGDQSDEVSYTLVVEENEDWGGMPEEIEEPVHQGMVGVRSCITIACVTHATIKSHRIVWY